MGAYGCDMSRLLGSADIAGNQDIKNNTGFFSHVVLYSQLETVSSLDGLMQGVNTTKDKERGFDAGTYRY